MIQKIYYQNVSDKVHHHMYTKTVVTKTRNRMEWNGLFRPVLFRIFHPKAIQYVSLNPKNFDLGVPNPKSKLSC